MHSTSSGVTSGSFALFYKDSAHNGAIMQYASDTRHNELAAWLALLNSRGASGWAYKGEMDWGAFVPLFVKDSARATTYSYSAPASTTLDWSGWLAQMNQHGSMGERFMLQRPFGTSSTAPVHALYMRTAASSASYSYTMSPVPSDGTTAAAFQSWLTAQGQQGLVLRGVYAPGRAWLNEGMLLERSSAQTAPIEYLVEELPFGVNDATAAQQVARHNAKVRDGYTHLTYFSIPKTSPGTTHMVVYVKGMQFPLMPLASGLVYP